MTLVVARLEALVIARALVAAQPLGELVKPLARFSPAELTAAAWRDRLAEVVAGLRAKSVLDPGHRLADAGELARRIGRVSARSWAELSDRVLPGLALGIAAEDGGLRARLDGRDAWAAAIAGRTLGLWVDGPPPSLPTLCDALVWRAHGLAGKPKRCPPELRAVYVERRLGSPAGSAERGVRLLAARCVGAPRPELRALRDALVRGWLAGRVLGPESADVVAATAFAGDVRRAADATTEGWFGDRKVFVSAVWNELRRDPRYAELALSEFKTRLVAAHRAGELELARADLVAAMDPALVAASEIIADGASFHFLVREEKAEHAEKEPAT